jgi:hypothetical protein
VLGTHHAPALVVEPSIERVDLDRLDSVWLPRELLVEQAHQQQVLGCLTGRRFEDENLLSPPA